MSRGLAGDRLRPRAPASLSPFRRVCLSRMALRSPPEGAGGRRRGFVRLRACRGCKGPKTRSALRERRGGWRGEEPPVRRKSYWRTEGSVYLLSPIWGVLDEVPSCSLRGDSPLWSRPPCGVRSALAPSSDLGAHGQAVSLPEPVPFDRLVPAASTS